VSTRAGKQASSGFMALFGLPFLAVGLGVCGWGVYGWYLYRISASWERVPATILSLEFKTHRSTSSKGGTSTTYSVACRYRYEYQGRSFTNGDVEILGGSSSEYGRHKRHYDILQPYKDQHKPYLAWVDPQDPQASLLFREPSMTMYVLPIFGLVFALVGGGVSGAGIIGLLGGRAKARRLARDPDRPWRAEGQWDAFTSRSGAVRTVIGSWAVGIFVTLFISIFFVALGSDPHAPFFAWCVVGFFGLVALGCLGWALYVTLRYLKYGDPQLVLTQLPIPLGGQFLGLLTVKRHLVADQGIDLVFKCVKRHTTGSGKNSHTTTTDVYTQTQTVTEDMAQWEEQGSAIPVTFAVPADQPARTMDENPSYQWLLEAKASTPGIDFAASFDLPVYRVDDPGLIEERPA